MVSKAFSIHDKPVRITRALLSLSDKSGLNELAAALTRHGVKLISTGGTFKSLKEAGFDVEDVGSITGFPEIMDGRVKTLHPLVHGGILGRRDDIAHTKSMEEFHIDQIDLVVINLYPFAETVKKGGDFALCVENVDIGGPAMIRAAAKNHDFVGVVTNPADYESLIADLDAHDGHLPYGTRRALAAKAFAATAAYDGMIAAWFGQQLGAEYASQFTQSGQLAQTLRYGENPHQSAAFYRDGSARTGIATAQQLQGKELSYNNLNDTDAAFELVSEFDEPAVAIIKHANPCGVATGKSMLEAYERAFACDTTSAFGGIIALNGTLDAATAAKIAEIFTEVIIAPSVDEEAKAIIAAKKNLRLLVTNGMADPNEKRRIVKSLAGGFLVQDADIGRITRADLKVVTKRQPTEQEIADMLFAFRVAKHVKSNAIVYAKNGVTTGIGAGQMSRVDSTRIAAHKGGGAVKGSVVASDAFFPFADGLITAAEAGATAIIQPGGSVKDADVIAAADERGLAMVMTGMRHFRH